MNKIKQFSSDFIGTFLNFIFIAINVTVHLAYHIIYTIYKFFTNVIRPAFIELLADLSFIGLIIAEMYYELASRVCLFISKNLLKYSKHCTNKSEEIIERTWAR